MAFRLVGGNRIWQWALVLLIWRRTFQWVQEVGPGTIWRAAGRVRIPENEEDEEDEEDDDEDDDELL